MRNKLLIFTILIVILSSYLTVGLLVQYNERIEIEAKDKKIKSLSKIIDGYKKNTNDLLNLNREIQDDYNKLQASKIENITEFSIGEDKISTEKLLEIVNKSFQENNEIRQQLKNKLQLLEMIKKSYGIETIETDKTLSLKITDASPLKRNESNTTILEEQLYNLKKEVEYNKELLKMIDDYGIKSSYFKEGKNIKFKITPSSKIDSAMMIYPYFKHKLFKDNKGEWRVKR